MRIALFDYLVQRTNPTGGCHRRLLEALAEEHAFTVFAVQFDNPCPKRITWVRVPAPTRPLALLFVAFHVLAPLYYWLYRWRTGTKFDLVQKIESNMSFGDLAYTHFCHTAYLKGGGSDFRKSGWRGTLQWLDHKLHAFFETGSYRAAQQIIVPSAGLAKELTNEFPAVASKVTVLSNAVDIGPLEQPASFDRKAFRQKLGFASQDTVFLFMALGQFERKGLPLLLDALANLRTSSAKLLVVGGNPHLVEQYRRQAAAQKLGSQVVLVGMQAEVGPFFWAADCFVFPSTYETFSLVAYEAAAASLPLIAPRLHGVEEILTQGETGFLIDRTLESLTGALADFCALPSASRRAMGTSVRAAALGFHPQRFVENWRALYLTYQRQIDRVGMSPLANAQPESTRQGLA